MRKLLCLAFVAALCVPAAAQDDDVARLFPSNTIVYAEADAEALMKGLPTLEVAALLGDPKMRKFLEPAFGKLDLDPENPVQTLMERIPVKPWLAGKVAVGFQGVTIRIGEIEIPISTHHVITARDVNKILGAVGTAALQGRDPDRIPVHISPDFAIVADVGEATKRSAPGMLKHQPELGIHATDVKLGDRMVKHFRYEPQRIEGNLYATPEFYADMSGDRWFVASSVELLAEMLAGGPRGTLANRPEFTAVRGKMTRDHRVVFAYADLAEAARIFKNFVPQITADLLGQIGVMSIQGAGFGLSITGGGVRESIGLVFDGDPRGLWTLLDALPGGMRALEVAPPDTLSVMGAKFDGKLLLQRTKEFLADFAPGTESMLSPMLAQAMAGTGFDLERDILAAFGDEVAVIMLPPEGFGLPVPQTVIGIDLDDEAAFKKLLGQAKRMAQQAGDVARIQEIEIVPPTVPEGGGEPTGGIMGWQVLAPLPIQPPTFAIHDGHFFLASGKALLAKVCTEWGAADAPNLVRNGEVFKRVLAGMNSGDSGNLVALAYVDLRKVLPLAFQGMQMFGQQLPQDWTSPGHMPDINMVAKHLTGMAVGLRKDKNGLVLDTFSQTGAILPALGWGVYETGARRRESARRAEEQAEFRFLQEAVQKPDAPFWGLQSLSTDNVSGITVLGTFEKGPARVAGIAKNDVILALNEQPTRSLIELRRATLQHKPGDTVKVKVRRGVETLELQMTFVRRGDFFPEAPGK